MGRSFQPPQPLPAGKVSFPTARADVRIEQHNGQMIHKLSESGLEAEYPVAYQIGSGSKGSTFAVAIGDYLFESPVSWFTKSGWNASPGYESLQLIDFDRPVAANCLFCHSGNARFADPDKRRLASLDIASISCARCHGSGEAHVQHPSKANIINPATLKGARRMNVCEQCHLKGDIRVLNPGKKLQDFRAGEVLEDTLVTYVLKRRGRAEAAVSQFQELAESKCARASGDRLWCGSCHDPHGPDVKDRQMQVREVCTSCHASLSKTGHPQPPVECISCHMPSRPTADIAHIAVTDHRIRRPNEPEEAYTGPNQVVAWREPAPDLRDRDLGVAEVQIGRDSHIASITENGMKLLGKLTPRQQREDPEMLTILQGEDPDAMPAEEALRLARMQTEAAPNSGIAAMNLGLALKRTGDAPGAEREFLRAIDLDQSLMAAYAELAVLYDRQGRADEVQKIMDRFLKWNPQNIPFRLSRQQ